jgi:hypothetical protein
MHVVDDNSTLDVVNAANCAKSCIKCEKSQELLKALDGRI